MFEEADSGPSGYGPSQSMETAGTTTPLRQRVE